ncbi:MAG TPA: hypothetical protein VGN72_10765 [Tepidisphaeraceae bacterium]|nr:hypothetical protein [Tepidisphaeraceae bacterium]
MNLVRRVENLELLRRRQVPPPPLPLDTPADVLTILAEQAGAVRGDVGADPTEKARTLVGLSAVVLRAMDSRDVQDRLEAVERVLKLRAREQRQANQKRS